ncbi:MAG: ATP-binding protein [Bacteroidales bacterium]
MSFSRQLFFSVISLFLAFVAFFAFYQHHREKVYRVELLDSRLQEYNSLMANSIGDSLCFPAVDGYVRTHSVDSLRVTIINPSGVVLYDSRDRNFTSMPNHLSRKEISVALKYGRGYDLKRNSQTVNDTFFYSATFFPEHGYIIRTSLPYNVKLVHLLAADLNFFWVSLAAIVLMVIVIASFSSRIGSNISQLTRFARMAEDNEDVENADLKFPGGELGDISRNIVRLYAKLQNSEDDKTRLKRQLTQNVAHELKTPVTSIRGYLETIVNDKTMDEGTKKVFLEKCYAQVQRLSDLLRDMSLLTKIDESSDAFVTEEVSVSELLLAVEEDAAQRLADHSDRFLPLVGKDVIIRGNRSLLYSIFSNLTDNALSYAGDGVTITVKLLKETSDSYFFSFSDDGCGVPEQHLAHLFERFYRVDKGRSRALGGTGLGLAIVKNSVILHHGEIKVTLSRSGGLDYRFSLAKNL